MKTFTLKKINHKENDEKFLCVYTEYASDSMDSDFYQGFAFHTKKEIEEGYVKLYTTSNKDEFTDEEIPSLDEEDAPYIFKKSDNYTLEIVEINLSSRLLQKRI